MVAYEYKVLAAVVVETLYHVEYVAKQQQLLLALEIQGLMSYH